MDLLDISFHCCLLNVILLCFSDDSLVVGSSLELLFNIRPRRSTGLLLYFGNSSRSQYGPEMGHYLTVYMLDGEVGLLDAMLPLRGHNDVRWNFPPTCHHCVSVCRSWPKPIMERGNSWWRWSQKLLSVMEHFIKYQVREKIPLWDIFKIFGCCFA